MHKNKIRHISIHDELAKEIRKKTNGNELLDFIYLFAVVQLLMDEAFDTFLCAVPMYQTELTGQEQKLIPVTVPVEKNDSFTELLKHTRDIVTNEYKNRIMECENDSHIINTSWDYTCIVWHKGIHDGDAENIINMHPAPIKICISTNNSEINIDIEYDCIIIKEFFITEFVQRFRDILYICVHDTFIPLQSLLVKGSKLEYRVEQEKFYDMDLRLHKLFELQVQKTPNRSAVICGEKMLTYMQLNELANVIANYLIATGVKVGGIVGICSGYQVELAAGILGILKAGAVYVPIDPTYPDERINQMINDCRMQWLLHDDSFYCSSPTIQLLALSDIKGDDTFNPVTSKSSMQPAYIIYTSGTEGHPKGVMVCHDGVVNYIQWRNKEYELGTEDRILQLVPISFDGFGSNFFSALLSGGCLVMPKEKERKDLQYIVDLIVSHKITHMSVVPAMFQMIYTQAADKRDLQVLRSVVLGGESASSQLIKEYSQILPEVRLINEYGPTEASIAVSAGELHYNNTKNIGKPIDNIGFHIMDENGNFSRDGEPGELYIYGIGVSNNSYYNDKKMTAEYFIQYPALLGNPLYRTRDIVRRLHDGSLEFLGRIDRQVKIHGNRIELNEIEHAFLSLSTVAQVRVGIVETEQGFKELCAYIVSSVEIDTANIRQQLKGLLPDYMIPNRMLQMETFPLLPNGKIDEHKLFSITGKNEIDSTIIVEELTSTQKFLTNIWREVLKRVDIPLDKEFFDLGGNSLLLMQMYSKIELQFPNLISVPDLFSYPTIHGLAQYLDKCKDKSDSFFPADKLQD